MAARSRNWQRSDRLAVERHRRQRTVVLHNARQITGNGATLQFTGQGRIVVAMNNAADGFSLSGAKVLWTRSAASDAQQTLLLQKGVLAVSGNTFYADSAPRSNDAPWLFTLAGDASKNSSASFTSNTFVSRYWNTVGLLNGASGAGIQPSRLRRQHGSVLQTAASRSSVRAASRSSATPSIVRR